MHGKRVKSDFWKSLPDLNREDAKWIAAVLDCEGTISVHTPWNKKRNNRNIVVFAKVEMIGYAIVERLHILCGGSLWKNIRQKGNRREHCLWNITSNGLRWLLPQIMPFLLIKKRHAEIVLEVLLNNERGKRPTQMKYERLAELLTEIRKLNGRGLTPDLRKIIPTRVQGKDVICLKKP